MKKYITIIILLLFQTTRFWNDVSKMNLKKGRVNEEDMNLNTTGGIKGNIYHPKHLGSASIIYLFYILNFIKQQMLQHQNIYNHRTY